VTTWIVDYDLPADNRRRNFYRHIAKYLAEMGLDEVTGWSTQSVIITEDKDFALYAYSQASQLGQAHLYKAERVK